MHFLVVETDWYEELRAALNTGATAALTEAGATFDTARVPGALEIPAAIAMAAMSGEYDGYVALGVVIRGETTHYDIVAGESSRALMDLAVQKGLCIGNGIQTVENSEQAWARCDPERKNKGGGAAKAAIAMVELKHQLASKPSNDN